jgi:hypothetical protein
VTPWADEVKRQDIDLPEDGQAADLSLRFNWVRRHGNFDSLSCGLLAGRMPRAAKSLHLVSGGSTRRWAGGPTCVGHSSAVVDTSLQSVVNLS